MSHKATPAFPDTPDRFPDDRDNAKRTAERGEIEKQIRYLKKFMNDKQRQRMIVDRLTQGRQARLLPPFVELSTGTVPALALPEFVVRRRDFEQPDVQKVIKKFRLWDEPVNALGGEVVRLTLPEPRQFAAMNAEVKNLPITPNYLVPLGGWTKCQGGPEPTASRPAWKPHGAERVQVAVIDTGLGHRTDNWLAGLTDPEFDQLYPDADYPDPSMPTLGLAAGHGTFVAGIVQQVEPSTDIRMYQALDYDGVGDDITLARKIVEAAEDGARVINLSLGTPTADDKPPPGVETGIRRAIEIDPKILIVCSAGNYGDTKKVWPAAFSLTFPTNVVAVTGLNPQGEKPAPEWPTHGDFVQLSTVAEGIVSTYVLGREDIRVENPPDDFLLNDWAIWSGTSFAAPQVTGAVASICLTNEVEPTEAVDILKSRGTAIPGYGAGVMILPGT